MPLERGDIEAPATSNDDEYDSSLGGKDYLNKFITDNEGTWTTCRLIFAAMIYVRNRRMYNIQLHLS